MNKIRRWSVAITVVLMSALLAGCAETKDGQTTQAQGTGIGAVIGAGLGAAIGGLTGGGEGALRGAALGGLAGGAAGFAYGTHVATQKAKYARAEDWLDACIASAQRTNSRARTFNRKLSIRLSSLQSRAKAAVASKNKAQIGQIRSEIASLKQEGAAQSKTVNGEVKAQQSALQDPAAKKSGKYGELRSSVGSLSATKAQLGQNLSRLAALENQIDI